MHKIFSEETIIVLVCISNLLLLGSSRLRACIRIMAIQGVLVGLLPVIMEGSENLVWTCSFSVLSIVFKGIVFPIVLFRILRETGTRREVEPYIGYSLSLLIGLFLFVFASWVNTRLAFHSHEGTSSLTAGAGMATILIGLLLTISRRKAVSQVLGYIVMENGIYTFGLTVVSGLPMLVELGVLMDVFVAVFIMSIAAYHINREFDHTDVDQLNLLKG